MLSFGNFSGMNVIFGIIVDTFSELRNLKVQYYVS